MNKQPFFYFVFLLCFFVLKTHAQTDPQWDDSKPSTWKNEFKTVEIPSTADGKLQKAYLYGTSSKTPKPLVVSLHTWSGTYSQKDPLITEILARDWNYIHPDFRGKNNHAESVGSALVVADIEDAIRYAIEHTNTNPTEVHIVGVSGGGYATLLSYMNVDYPVKSFSAWVPISDIDAWYWESVGRKQKYATDILRAVGSDGKYSKEEALRRSPRWQPFPKEKRKEGELFIYAGIHDGYTGSVPITHSLFMYNRLVGDLKYNVSDMDEIMKLAGTDSVLVSPTEIISLISKRTTPDSESKPMLFGRTVHLYKKYNNISLTIFEGEHEQLPQALSLLSVEDKTELKLNILTLGDSNAQSKTGWSNQLRAMLPQSRIINISQSGRTIGFDNGGKKSLNALRNIRAYLDKAQTQLAGQKLNTLIVCLGTNDTKNEFADRQDEVIANLDSMFYSIKNHSLYATDRPQLIFVTPPPMRIKIEEKYLGGNERLAKLFPQFKLTAEKYDFDFVDIFNSLQGVFNNYASDGVHMSGEGQKIIAAKVLEAINENQQ